MFVAFTSQKRTCYVIFSVVLVCDKTVMTNLSFTGGARLTALRLAALSVLWHCWSDVDWVT